MKPLLATSLCNEVGQELYEMNITVRQVLLKHLTQRYGQERLNKLSEFLLEYVARQMNHLDSGIIQAQTWTALAYVNTTEAAKQITLKLTKMLQQYNQSDWLQMTFLVETLTEPLKTEGFQPLLALAQGMEQSARGDLFGAEKQFDELRHQLGSSPTIAGVSISIPPPPIPAKRFSFDVVTVNAVGEIVQQESCKADYFKEDLGNSVTLEMVYIPEGTFLMGSPETEEGHMERESPQHEVTLQPFFMGKYPITQAQWRAIAALPQVNRELDPDPSEFKGSDRPVESVSWYEAVEFCDRLSIYSKRNYRLPSEAEWEYACRAGTTTPFHFGETITPELANYDGNFTYGSGSKGEDRERTTPVGSFKVANAFGLFDMHGNVWEWCADNWHEKYENTPLDNANSSNIDNDNRLLRGGSWVNNPRNCRSAYRNDALPDYRIDFTGFRVVLSGART
ncbi:formylglycine-generating enzyme family protein [Scytonema hofmannii]|uniref:formylglycine-generating enzyme family protein n=1 Tax=Scytonema hofmannii TaxID=34078 RepID=UPI0009D644B6|nr:formylglycine-generating enzyme family protein [Scytonema hofmannii]